MTNYERIHIAMNHGKADRVSVMCQLSQEFMARNSGIKHFDMYYNANCYANTFLKLRKEFNFDGILLNTIMSDNWQDFYSNTEITTVDGFERYKMPDGMIYEQHGRNFVCVTINSNPKYPEVDDIEPDEVNYNCDYSKMMALHKLIIAEGKKDSFSVHGEITSPFDKLVVIFGTTNSMMALLLDPDKCHEILERALQQSYNFAKTQIDVGVDTMKISSPFAGGSFISTDHYKEFVLPYEKQLVSMIHQYKPGIPIYTHTCGFIGDRLELIAATGVDGIECMDPPPLGNTLLKDAKERIGRDLFLKGNMDSVNVLLKATEEIIDKYVRDMINDGGTDGGYILSSACSVAPGVNPDIIRMLVPLAEKYGRYN